METNYSRPVSQKKIKMKTKQHQSNEKEIKVTDKEIEEKLDEFYVNNISEKHF